MTRELRLSLSNDLGEIERLADELSSWAKRCSLAGDTLHDLSVALDDIVTNVISYAYPEGGRHVIEVSLEHHADHIDAMVIDHGIAFNLLTARRATTEGEMDNRPIGGLGIHLADTLMDTLTYERDGNRNIVRMMKRIHA